MRVDRPDPPGLHPTGLAGWAREWDGHAWAPTPVPDAAAPALPAPRPGPLAVLRRWTTWWALGGVALGVVIVVAAQAAAGSAPPSGLLLGLAGAVGCGATLSALLVSWRGRTRWWQAAAGAAPLAWGVAGGAVAVAVALPVEIWWGRLVDAGAEPWRLLVVAGPLEQAAVLAVPLALFAAGRYRDPRAGLAVAVVAAATFGWAEGILFLGESAATGPAADQVELSDALLRPVVELLHPLLAAYVAAATWRTCWTGRGVARPLLATWAVASVVHVAFDLLAEYRTTAALAYVVLAGAWAGLTVPAVRELVPPGAIAVMPAWWRPRVRTAATTS